MRTVSSGEAPTPTTEPNRPTFSATLSDGRTITIREMTGRDLVYMEKELRKFGDVEKGMKMIERISVGGDKITFEEILDLGVRDFRKLSELVSKANGDEDEEEKKEEDEEESPK